jgi:chromatin segregation and condensation protein Rec8/ScpA/Scc1 (kleisin family)
MHEGRLGLRQDNFFGDLYIEDHAGDAVL